MDWRVVMAVVAAVRAKARKMNMLMIVFMLSSSS
jgi:hypothetical protein